MLKVQRVLTIIAASVLALLVVQPVGAQGDFGETYLPVVNKTLRITNDFELLDLICNGDSCVVEVVPNATAALASTADLDTECTYRTEVDPLKPIAFSLPRGFITEVTPLGDLVMKGDLTLEIADEVIPLVEAEVRFTRGKADLGQFEFVSGKVLFPTTLYESRGFGVTDDEVVSRIGLEAGKNLADLDVPLCPDLKYLFFMLEGTRTNSLVLDDNTNVSYEMAAGTTLVVDPLDASLQVALEIPLVGKGSFGYSQQGLLPYVPQTTWGIEDYAEPFTGHVYNRIQDIEVATKFGIPLLIKNGLLVIDGDPDGDTPVFSLLELASLQLNPVQPISLLDFDDLAAGRVPDRGWGVNGEIALAIPVIGEIDDDAFGEELFDFDLGEASANLLISDAQKRLYFSGRAQGEAQMPLQAFNPAGDVRIAGYISDELTDFDFKFEGEFELVPNALFAQLPFDFNPMQVMGSASANIEGIEFSGTTTSQIYPGVIFDGATTVEFDLPFTNVAQTALAVSGQASIPAIGLAGNGKLMVDKVGMSMSGSFDLAPTFFSDLAGVGLNPIQFDGTVGIGLTSYTIKGRTSSQIHPQIQLVNAEIDGYIDLLDPTASFLNIKGNMSAAGVGLGASASMMISKSGIGVEGVFSSSVNDVKLSGSLTNAGINLSGATNLQLRLATPAVRGRLSLGVCRPLLPGESSNCTLVPAVDLGTFKTSVALSLVNIGIGGSASGQYCTAGGACQSIGVELELSGTPKACATIPVINEKVCINI